MRYLAFLLCFLISAASVSATVRMPSVFGDNMVLQQNDTVLFWGSAKPDSKIRISVDWAKKPIVTRSDDRGMWTVGVPTPPSGGPYTISVCDDEILRFDNVLVGEVWLCSGQSNMEMPVQGFEGQPVHDAAGMILSADPDTPIRIYSVEKDWADTLSWNCKGNWQLNSPETVAKTSAVAYNYAKILQSALKVPVGIIVSAVGGTKIEPWIKADVLESQWGEHYSEFIQKQSPSPKSKNRLGVLYNAMIHPIVPFAIKGWIWYQGESNIPDYSKYARLQAIYTKMMRSIWNRPDMPFYFVQIAPFSYPKYSGNEPALLRQAQQQSLSLIPHSGMATTVDVGDADCIHPSRKKEVAERLALMALADSYGLALPGVNAPLLDKVEFIGGKVRVSFSNNDFGLGPRGGDVLGLEVAGNDNIYHKASGRIIKGNDNTDILEVYSEFVPTPVAVRYAFGNAGVGNLVNGLGLPVAPFMFDNLK